MSNDKKQLAVEEVKTEKLSNEDALRKVAMEIVPLAIAAALGAKQPEPARATSFQTPRRGPECTECKQAVSACGGRHASMVVYPQRYPEHGQFFPGYILNGVTYLSNDESHEVLVPADCVSDINGAVQRFEQNEKDMSVGRKAQRQSGVVTPQGTSFKAADAAWR